MKEKKLVRPFSLWRTMLMRGCEHLAGGRGGPAQTGDVGAHLATRFSFRVRFFFFAHLYCQTHEFTIRA